MCQTAVALISKALPEVDNAENILKIKNLIALFMQTMNVGDPSFHKLRSAWLTCDIDLEFPRQGFR